MKNNRKIHVVRDNGIICSSHDMNGLWTVKLDRIYLYPGYSLAYLTED